MYLSYQVTSKASQSVSIQYATKARIGKVDQIPKVGR